MIDAHKVTLICVTRGDVELPVHHGPINEFIVWDNSKTAEDLGVFGRYAAIELASNPVILVQDDDVELSLEAVEGLLDAYEPGKIVANLPNGQFRERYTDSTLVGFGAIFDRDLPAKAFARFRKNVAYADEQWFRRTCDVVFTTLTPFTLVDLPFAHLEHAYHDTRMYRQENHGKERQQMLNQARKVRDVR